MLPSILIVDDEVEVLKALQRVLRDDYDVHLYENPTEALAFYKETPTQIVISDMKMPTMSGAEFLKRIYEINPRTKRVVLTGYADTEMAVKAINEGHTSIYLNKPWNNDELKIKLADLISELKDENKKLSAIKKLKADNQRLFLNQKSLDAVTGFIQEEYDNSIEELSHVKTFNNQLLRLSANLVSMYSHDMQGHTHRVAHQAKALGARLGLKELTNIRIYLAALFYRVGMYSLPSKIIDKPWDSLSAQERHLWVKFPQASADIIGETDILKASADIVKHLYENIDGSGSPDHLSQQHIPIGSRVLSIVVFFDLLVSGKVSGLPVCPTEALIVMKPMVGQRFDNKIFGEFVKLIEAPKQEELLEVPKSVDHLCDGMVVAQDILNHNEQKILGAQTVLTQALILRLVQYQEKTQKPLIVYINV